KHSRNDSEAHSSRLAEVLASISSTGTYELTKNELIFGAKTAWRNAPRCVGRIQWNKLHVFDCRKVTSTREMFDAICVHLKYATNKGNIRSCITFFPPRNDVKTEFRVWNSQLIRYACYRQEDGSLVGDPANLELTELCMRLGWKGKGGRFDLLPLLLQANGEDPELYELPANLVLEVKLRHPEQDWLEQMNLKWYAVPAVSNILLDIGGVEFPAVPFNGWFMGTEIGRDLVDTSRYNMILPMAEAMGLNTKKTSSLWKDKAILELNLAILHSFQSDNVTIMDHHVATESFMKHFANEVKLRGGCPGDWVWLVPPVSGSATPVFHQEILNYTLNPSCLYQPDPWQYYKWKDTVMVKRKNKLHFKELAKSVMVTSRMMKKAMANRIKTTILYATETGKSYAYSLILQEIFNHAFDAKVVAMDQYDICNLEYESMLLVVTSTFGNGDPPENGEDFLLFSFINIEHGIHKIKSSRFAVFGLGSRAYPHFCAFAHAVDTLLGELEGERVKEIGEGDEMCGQEECFRNWAQQVFKVGIIQGGGNSFDRLLIFNLEDANASLKSTKFDKSNFRVTVSDVQVEPNYVESKRSTILIQLEKKNSDVLNFQPGDHLGIYPRNDPALVKALISKIRDATDDSTVVRLEYWDADTRLPSCTLTMAFSRFLDITTPPTPQLLKLFSECNVNEEQSTALRILGQGESEYEDWKFSNNPNLVEVLNEFPSTQVDASLLLKQLPLLQARYYSISSSPDVYPGEIHCTVSVVTYHTRGGDGPLHHGVCSSYLNSITDEEEVPCFVRMAPTFHLPTKEDAPCILVGPGTGIAPFRSFWQHRISQIQKGDRTMALLFGCRNPQQDHLYKDEVETAMKQGAISHAYTAFSREEGKPKQYVQDVIMNDISEFVFDLIHTRNGHFYVCGDVTMAAEVHRTLKDVLCINGGMTPEQVEEYITAMKSEDRYHEDIFGVTLRTYEVNRSL
uniref:Nitric oxide synthase 3 n=1 Tax=Ciona savignyi TaxID=51511 RepID=H2ZG23_CIOSA